MPKKKTRARARPHEFGCTCAACTRSARARFGLDPLPRDPQHNSNERYDYVKGGGRPNDLPAARSGDSLREELTDLLGMLSHLQALIPQRRPEAALQQAADCYALLRSILGPEPTQRITGHETT